MLKYLTKIAMDMFPSVLATIIGAYIVNHYINARPADPVAAAASTADPKKADATRAAARPAGASVNVANIPAPGVTAKGISERAIIEKSAAERAETKPAEAKPAEVKPAETATAPAEQRRRQPTLREKVLAKIAPAPAPAPYSAPVVAAPAVAPSAETAAAPVAPEDRRDANDLARAAIERLRSNPEAARTQEAARAVEPSRPAEPPRVAAAPAVPPLPPPITVSTSAADGSGSAPANPPYTSSIRTDDPDHPTPPADIPAAPPPLDLRADAGAVAPRERTTVAEGMLSAAKSIFHAVLPKSATPD